jgi:nucleoside-diphosphate-sugar epimerase
MVTAETHVILGSGIVGTKLATKLSSTGDRVILISRSSTEAKIPNVERFVGDATSFESLMAIATKADYVYNCVNPPYNSWDQVWPRINSAVNKYVIETQSVLVTCSNLYGYGEFQGVLTEDLPLKATWRNGQTRAEMWLQNKSLHDVGKMRATEVRGSDYICASDQSRMGDRVVPKLIEGKKVQLLGALDKLHTWTDPGDVANLMSVIAKEERAWGKPWHVPSNPPKTQLQVVQDIAKEIGLSNPKVSSVPKAMHSLLGIINPILRELKHTSYQFDNEFVMSDEKARREFGLEPKPWKVVIKDLVAQYTKREA